MQTQKMSFYSLNVFIFNNNRFSKFSSVREHRKSVNTCFAALNSRSQGALDGIAVLYLINIFSSNENDFKLWTVSSSDIRYKLIICFAVITEFVDPELVTSFWRKKLLKILFFRILLFDCNPAEILKSATYFLYLVTFL